MKKVKINLKINDYLLKTEGFLNNNILSFYDNDKLRTNIIYDYNTDTLIRDNSEITIKLFFNKNDNNIEYCLKENNLNFYNKMEEKKLLKNKTTYIINYRIDDALYDLHISYEME